MTSFEVILLGTNSALPAFGRFPTAQVLRIQNECFLIDCGEGTQMRMQDFNIRPNQINQIFISHLHGDHFYGLIGLLTTLSLLGRSKPLHIYAPQGLEEIIRIQTQYAGGEAPYAITFHLIDTERHYLIFENAKVAVYTIPLDHRIPTSGFLFREKEKDRAMIGATIAQYNIPYQAIPAIKKGQDFILPDGQVIANHLLTEAPSPPRSYAYCSDTRYKEAIIPIIKGVDLLYHEATFCDNLEDKAAQTGHSTARQAAQIAKLAEVGQLLLGHFSSRYENIKIFEAEARTVFDKTVAGREGETYSC